MNLRKKLLKYPSKDLIEVAEPHSDYTHEAKTIAIDIIKENNAFDFKNEAQIFWKEKIKKDIRSILNSKEIPKSLFINESEMRLIIKTCFENWKEEQELFGIDTTKYWVV
jgi:hypothetical protein|tara:strand:+ start:368 stop:697 length:330 start_codon:yes stop_codon:yes gene_type:complete